GLARARYRELNPGGSNLALLNRNALHFSLLEAGRVDRNVISARLKSRDAVVAVGICCNGAGRASALVGNCDRGIANHGAGLVHYSPRGRRARRGRSSRRSRQNSILVELVQVYTCERFYTGTFCLRRGPSPHVVASSGAEPSTVP